jgi:hypothetical protein
MPYDTTIFEGDTIIDSLEALTPEENYLLGAEFHLDLFEGAFRLESEASVSEHTRDTRMEVQEWEWLPEWVTNTFKPRLSTSLDFAYAVRPSLDVFDTRVYGELEFVGPGYTSLGATSLRSDNFAYGAGIERDFFDRQVSAAASFSRENDNNLSSEDSLGNEITLKAETTVFTSYVFDLGLYFINVPYLQVSYAPYTEVSDSMSASATVLSVATGYDFMTGTVSHSPSVSFSYQGYDGDGDESDYTAFDVGLYHSVGFEFPLSASASFGLARTSYASDTVAAEQSIYVDLSPSYTAFNSWNNTLNIGGSFDEDGSRFDVGLNSTFPVWKICDGQVGVTRTNYSGDDGSYGEWRVNAGLSRSW